MEILVSTIIGLCFFLFIFVFYIYYLLIKNIEKNNKTETLISFFEERLAEIEITIEEIISTENDNSKKVETMIMSLYSKISECDLIIQTRKVGEDQ
jgi:uncharacterized membrane protein